MSAKKLRLVDHSSTYNVAPAEQPELISPFMNIFLIGGASVALLALMTVAIQRTTPEAEITWAVFSLSFVANFPHFLSSYLLLYSDNRSQIFRKFRFTWAAVIAPALLLGILGFGLFTSNPKIWTYLASSMYFFVGWHYVKQIFGGIVVSNVMEKYFYKPLERFALKANLFSLWAISFLAPNLGQRTYTQDGISYSSYDLPYWTMDIAFACLAISGAVVFLLHLQRYIRDGRLPSKTAMVCFASIYAWYLPAFSHPMYMHLIPFFHSIQYLLFVYVLRRNKVNAHIENPNTPEARKTQVFSIYGYLVLSAVLGGALMYFIPRFIDSQLVTDHQLFGPTPAYFAFILFINIHHYFIDNVLWRGDNEETRKYLFSARPAA